ncbi:MAG: inositol monophosphatase [Micromonosporaceae bacterium]|nr:inositol monophosphatase [Micromonosporaceae bacterium]
MRRADPGQLLTIASELARAAGERARAMREEGISQVSTKSTPTDVVTAADRAAERLIVEELRERRPYDHVLGEESGAHRGDGGGSRVRWLVDPIDGTVNYLYGIPYYAVSLGVEVDGEVVAGVVRNPVTGEEWSAVRGGGAHRDGRRLTGSTVTELSQTMVATGFGYDPARRAHQARVVASLLAEVRDIRRFGAAALDLCLVAEGRVDAFYEKGLAPWDLAAGGLIAEAAGVLVTGLRGRPAGKRMTLAAPASVHGELHDRLVAWDAEGGP